MRRAPSPPPAASGAPANALLANYTYTSALLANAIRLLADELEQSQPAQPSTAQPGFAFQSK